MEEFVNTNKALNELSIICEKATNITASISQLLYELNKQVYKYKSNSISQSELNKLVDAIIFTLAPSFSSSKSEVSQCILWKPDEDNKYLVKHYSNSSNLDNDKKLLITNSFVGRIYQTGKERKIDNIDAEDEFFNDRQKRKYKSLAGVPLLHNDKVVAVLTIDAKKENAFTGEDMDNLKIFASMICICLLLKG